MAESITFVVSGPPVAKARARVVRTKEGRTFAYTPSKTRKYEAHARLCAQQAMKGRSPIEGAVTIVMRASLPIPKSFSKRKTQAAMDQNVWHTKRPDLDNLIKSALDAASGIVFTDDSQVIGITASKFYSRQPALSVTVIEHSSEAA